MLTKPLSKTLQSPATLNTNIKHLLDKMASDVEDVFDVLEFFLHITRNINPRNVRPYLQQRTFNI